MFADPNTDVIYVAPVPINEEMAQYYGKLLGLKSAINSGNVEDQQDFTDRYKIITPEATQYFPVRLAIHHPHNSRISALTYGMSIDFCVNVP